MSTSPATATSSRPPDRHVRLCPTHGVQVFERGSAVICPRGMHAVSRFKLLDRKTGAAALVAVDEDETAPGGGITPLELAAELPARRPPARVEPAAAPGAPAPRPDSGSAAFVAAVGPVVGEDRARTIVAATRPAAEDETAAAPAAARGRSVLWRAKFLDAAGNSLWIKTTRHGLRFAVQWTRTARGGGKTSQGTIARLETHREAHEAHAAACEDAQRRAWQVAPILGGGRPGIREIPSGEPAPAGMKGGRER